MTEFIAALFLVTMTAGIAVLLEVNHRRTDGLPRAPFGSDVEGDSDLWRLRHDLDAAPSTRFSGRHARFGHHGHRTRAA